MKEDTLILFPPFRLDLANEQLWCETQFLKLRPKQFAVLRHLVEHADQLVTKENLLNAVWANTHVSEEILRGYVRDLRKILGDDPKSPKFIKTIDRRGYRFIRKLAEQGGAEVSLGQQEPVDSSPKPSSPPVPRSSMLIRMVDREAELQYLEEKLEKAQSGERQIVFVTGEPGIGKTTVIRAFLERVVAKEGMRIGYGQCAEHYGTGEAYLPVLEALGRLCRAPGGDRLVSLLRRYAPLWLAQIPWLLDETAQGLLQQRTQGATSERMLREFAEAVEVLTAEQPLVLWLEDLQWSDYSTSDLLATLGRRPEAAQLLVIGTYRPADVIVSQHPVKALKQQLQMYGQCEELALRFLTEDAVGQYLSMRFSQNKLPPTLSQVIYQRTEGNPFFMVSVVDSLVAQGAIVRVDGSWELRTGIKEVEEGIPESSRQMIEKQIGGMSEEEQLILEAASVAGEKFSVAAVAAGSKQEVETVEKICEKLSKREQFLQACGKEEWSDGTIGTCYEFIHALYQEVLYNRIAPGRCVQFHRLIGERKEEGYGERKGEIAGELAVHFEQGADYPRAVQYHRQAGEKALQRYAYEEALDHFTKGLELLQTFFPDTPERAHQELSFRRSLGVALVSAKGFGAPEMGPLYTKARELVDHLSDPVQLAPFLIANWASYLVRGELRTAQQLADEFMHLAQNGHDPAPLPRAYNVLGATFHFRGEFSSARACLERVLTLYDPQQHGATAFFDPETAAVTCRACLSWVLWILGYPEQSLQSSREALGLARQCSSPFIRSLAVGFTALVHQCLRDGRATKERADETIGLATEQGLALWVTHGTLLRDWALADLKQNGGAFADWQRAVDELRNTGPKLMLPYHLGLLAGEHGKQGCPEEGLTAIAEALTMAQEAEGCWYEAELYRLKGELLLAQTGKSQKSNGKSEKVTEVESCFRRAINIARNQSAKSLELRAVMSFSRLLYKQGRKREARQMLAEVYEWFTEGFDTKDLQEAKKLLKEWK